MASSALLSGAVDDVIEYGQFYGSSRKPSIFIVKKVESGNRYKVKCNFTCPIQPGDGISLIVNIPPENGIYNVSKHPFVQIPTERDDIIRCFIAALRGTGFGQFSGQTLYDKLEELAFISGYGIRAKERMMQNREPDISFIPSLAEPKSQKGEQKLDSEKEELPQWVSEDPPESCLDRYVGDGVIGYLTDLASNYNKTRDDKLFTTLVAGTKLNASQVKKLVIWWYKKRSLRRLQLLGIDNKEIDACKMHLDAIYNICIDNPYRLPAISEEKCATIFETLGKAPTSTQVQCGKIVRKLYSNVINLGWSRTPFGTLMQTYSSFESYRPELEREYGVIFKDPYLYLERQYIVETSLVDFFDRAIKKSAEAIRLEKLDSDPELEHINIFKCKTLTDEQKRATVNTMKLYLSFICGGGGVGKTIVLSEIEYNLKLREIPYICTSFTGKAVARIHEVLGNRVSAFTMHRLIARSNQVCKFKYVIVDEISMIDAELFYNFINAFQHDYRFILIGDANQLMPIGWGTVMLQLIGSGRVPTFYLTQNHRIMPHPLDSIESNTLADKTESPGVQTFDRQILANANALIDPKRKLNIPFSFSQGTSFFQEDSSIHYIETILRTLKDADIEGKRIACICPFSEPCIEINKIFQTIFLEKNGKIQDPNNPNKYWYIGDRVKMTRNNYDINVMNGEEAYLIEIKDDGLIFEFTDGARHLFTWRPSTEKNDYEARPGYATGKRPEWASNQDEYTEEPQELLVEMLKHSAAGTVHDYQGSEKEFIIAYVPEQKKRSSFLNIKMIYTMITRAKRAIWLVGHKETIRVACSKPAPFRYEGLGERLKQLKDESEKYLEEFIAPPVDDISLSSSVALAGGDFGHGEDEDEYEAMYR